MSVLSQNYLISYRRLKRNHTCDIAADIQGETWNNQEEKTCSATGNHSTTEVQVSHGFSPYFPISHHMDELTLTGHSKQLISFYHLALRR